MRTRFTQCLYKLIYHQLCKIQQSRCRKRDFPQIRFFGRNINFILIEKEKITNHSNKVIKKESLLVKNDEIAKTFK